MIPAKNLHEMSEEDFAPLHSENARRTLEKFERAKVLDVYFARVDGRAPENIKSEFEELYRIDLVSIKKFLLEQHPLDPILHSILKVLH